MTEYKNCSNGFKNRSEMEKEIKRKRGEAKEVEEIANGAKEMRKPQVSDD